MTSSRTSRAVVGLLAGLLAMLTGCQSAYVPQNKVIAIATVEPHAFLVEQIGGERVQVEVLVPTGKEPESYQVTPDKLVAFSQAHLFFRTGMPMEDALLPKLESLSEKLRIVDLRDDLPLRPIEIHHHHESDHEHHDTHAQTDPHIWFAPTLLKTEAEAVLHALQQCDPEGAETYQENYEKVLQEIETVRQKITEMLTSKQREIIFVFHPSYGYFCEEFGLRQWAIEHEGKSPKPQQLAELIEETKKMPGTAKIFIQPEFSQSSAQAVAETIGAEVVVHSTLERNVLQSMFHFAELIGK